jgi:hypothetical protein
MIRTVLLIAALAACGKSKDTGGAAQPSGGSGQPSAGSAQPSSGSAQPSSGGALAAGTYTGTWTRTVGPKGGGDLVLTVGATTTLRRANTLCPPDETPATVTVAGDKVTIEVATDAVKSTHTGTRSGNEITGELTTTCSAGTGHGTWKLTAP